MMVYWMLIIGICYFNDDVVDDYWVIFFYMFMCGGGDCEDYVLFGRVLFLLVGYVVDDLFLLIL